MTHSSSSFDFALMHAEPSDNFMDSFFDNEFDLLSKQWVADAKVSPVAAAAAEAKPLQTLEADTNASQEAIQAGTATASTLGSSPVLEAPHTTEQSSEASTDDDKSQTERKKSISSPASSKKRTRANQEQLAVLEEVYSTNPSPNGKLREALAGKLGMSERSIQIWFQNRRAKSKLLQRRRSQFQEEMLRMQSMYSMLAGQGALMGANSMLLPGMMPTMGMMPRANTFHGTEFFGKQSHPFVRHSISGPSTNMLPDANGTLSNEGRCHISAFFEAALLIVNL
jgi:hypothetical protein